LRGLERTSGKPGQEGNVAERDGARVRVEWEGLDGVFVGDDGVKCWNHPLSLYSSLSLANHTSDDLGTECNGRSAAI
jgi:hypothetical protein